LRQKEVKQIENSFVLSELKKQRQSSAIRIEKRTEKKRELRMTSASTIRSNSRKAHLTRVLLVPAATLIVAGGLIGMNGLESAAPGNVGSTINPPLIAAQAPISTMWQRPTASYFIVASEVQHDEVVAEQAREAERRRAAGEPQYFFAVVVVAADYDSELDARGWFREFRDDWERRGAVDIKTIDLRSAAVAPASVSRITERPTASYYIVGSVAQHDRVVAEQTLEADRRRAAGEPEYFFAVVVADTLESGIEAYDWFKEFKGNWARRGAVDVKTIDLRDYGGSGVNSPVDYRDYLANQEYWDELVRQ
jgi:hypothetical protein